MDTKDVYEKMTQEEVYEQVLTRSGCREPFLQGGIRNYFGWRNIGLNINLSYSIGSKIRLMKMYGSANTFAPGPETNSSIHSRAESNVRKQTKSAINGRY